MPPYRANLGGIEGSGQYATGSGAPDYASIISAVAGGASSLIQNAYMRKMARNQQVLATQREAREQAKQQADADFRDRELSLRGEEMRLKKLTAGVTPAHDEATPGVPATDLELRAALPPVQPGTVSLQPGAAPTPGAPTPAQPPVRLRTPAVPPGTVAVPESYDPTKAEGYLRTIDVAKLRADATKDAAASARTAAMERVERTAELTAKRQADHDQRVAKGKAATVGRGLTANALETWRKAMADGIISQHDGDLNAAEDFIANDPLGRKYAVRGVSGEDLYAAAGRFRSGAARAATGILGSTSPERAVEKVGRVRRLMTPGGAKAGDGAPAPAASAPGAGAPPSGVPASDAKAVKTPLARDPISKAERASLLKLGWSDAQIQARYTITP